MIEVVLKLMFEHSIWAIFTIFGILKEIFTLPFEYMAQYLFQYALSKFPAADFTTIVQYLYMADELFPVMDFFDMLSAYITLYLVMWFLHLTSGWWMRYLH